MPLFGCERGWRGRSARDEGMSAGRARHPRDAALGEQARGADSVSGGQASGATTDHHVPTRPGRSAIRTRPASYRAIRSAGPAGGRAARGERSEPP
jgi:hypothetical protein